MARQQIPLSPPTNDVAAQPALYLVAEAGVDRSTGYIGVLLRYTKMQDADGAEGARRKDLQESHFLMSSSEACELRDLLNQALAGMGGATYH